MSLIKRITENTGILGSIVSGIGCVACFPALASFGAAIGLGFLSQYEGLFITTLLPLFAVLALFSNVLGWFEHRQWRRTAPGVAGSLLALLAALLMRFYSLPTAPLLYVGLALMVGASIWDLVSPARRYCGPNGCALPAKQG